MNERQQRALEIAAKTKIRRKAGTWLVPSQTGNGAEYRVDGQVLGCTCLDFEKRGTHCKHMFAVEYVLERERSITTTVEGNTTTTTVTEVLRYKQMWSAYNSAQTNEKAKFLALLYELCAGIDEPIKNDGQAATLDGRYDLLFRVQGLFYCFQPSLYDRS